MCTSSGLSPRTYNPVGQALGDDYQKLDPLAYGLEDAQRGMENMDEVPDVKMPDPVQDAKQPDRPTRTQRRGPARSSTLLTGPQGITQSALTTGAPTLLGG